MTTFTWVPEFGSQKQVKPTVTQVKFGDGYEQRFASGLNSQVETWTLNFAQRESAESAALIAFLEASGGVTAFNWTPPGSTAKVFICRTWTVTSEKGGRYTITAQLEQIFEP